ncbi:MAG TPA: c-type cytochrome [Candidatus Limnocylindria bacterium]|jgi:polar amino acid transport system substrate-binding protein|nr:c-type cytochrome [Candidatus Limnocylindria bacterium]
MKQTRKLVITAAAVLACTGIAGAASATDQHGVALAALADVRASVSQITAIEDGYAVGHPTYLRAAHRALNALVGRGDHEYDAAAGDPGDGVGAIGHVDRLLDRNGTTRWTNAVQGAKANLLAAVQNLHDALHEKEMEDYEGDLTQALANLSLATGRPDREGALGGIAGALGTTSLGVPSGVAMVSGCSTASRAPAYGVVDGRLVYVALPRASGMTSVPDDVSVSRVAVDHDKLVLYTAAGASASPCAAVSHAKVPHRTRNVAHTDVLQRVRDVVVAAGSSAPAAPYTTAQAKAGAKVYATSCIQCHGANLQGTAAPGVAGKEFLTTAKGNKWTLSSVRTLVFENMPLNDPGSLTPTQYAQVMAYLLASNCYPAGSQPFPEKDNPAFAKVAIQPLTGVKPDNAQYGTCTPK